MVPTKQVSLARSWKKVILALALTAGFFYTRLIDMWRSCTVSQYVPAVGKVLGTDQKEEGASRDENKIPGPPERPHHDTQIEEFIKDQHRSKGDDGKLT